MFLFSRLQMPSQSHHTPPKLHFVIDHAARSTMSSQQSVSAVARLHKAIDEAEKISMRTLHNLAFYPNPPPGWFTLASEATPLFHQGSTLCTRIEIDGPDEHEVAAQELAARLESHTWAMAGMLIDAEERLLDHETAKALDQMQQEGLMDICRKQIRVVEGGGRTEDWVQRDLERQMEQFGKHSTSSNPS